MKFGFGELFWNAPSREFSQSYMVHGMYILYIPQSDWLLVGPAHVSVLLLTTPTYDCRVTMSKIFHPFYQLCIIESSNQTHHPLVLSSKCQKKQPLAPTKKQLLTSLLVENFHCCQRIHPMPKLFIKMEYKVFSTTFRIII